MSGGLVHATAVCHRSSRATALAVLLVLTAALPRHAQAQSASDPDTRAGQIAAAQAGKASRLRPYRAPVLEGLIRKIEETLADQQVRWHPFYGHAYSGAGITLGAGYKFFTGDYAFLDARAAMSLNRSKRAELEFRVPRLTHRRAALRTLGGWSEGLEQSFYGVGSGTGRADRTTFDFRRTYAAAVVDVAPQRNMFVFGGGTEISRYEQIRREGSAFDLRYPAGTLPGAGARVDYVQARGHLALDWRPAAGYARSGGAHTVTARRFFDISGPNSFTQLEYDAVQHLPLLRDAWVLSLHARTETTYTTGRDEVPFFMLPTLGNTTTLRAFTNMRFRDRNSVVVSAEWRVFLNQFAEAALFYDAGKVTRTTRQLDFHHLRQDYGVGFRIHSLRSTPLRIDVARGDEGYRLVFAGTAAF